MSNGLHNGLDNGLYNGLYSGQSNGLVNGLYSNDVRARLNNPVINLDAGDRRSGTSNMVKWIDLTNNNYNGILLNSAAFSITGQGCIRCPGGSAYVEIENSDKIKLGADNFTVEYWVNKRVTTVGAGWNGVWGANKWITGGLPGQNEWALSLGDANVDQFQFYIEANTSMFGTGVYPLTINQWYQAVAIRKGEKLQLYVNGVLRHENTFPFFNQNTIINHTGKKIRIHNSYLNSYYAAADVAIFKFYKKALSKEEVMSNFNSLRRRFGI